MMGSSGFPIDLVLFAMIAGFLVLRLRSILGRRTGFERPPQTFVPPGAQTPPTIDGRAEPAPPPAARAVPEPSSVPGAVLAKMREFDRAFDPSRFLDGAEQAFRMIVHAFAAGDRAALRNLLSDETFRSFSTAIDGREAAGEVQRSEIKAIPSVTIETAELRGSLAAITVAFVSDQVSFTSDKEGRVISGADAVTELTDVWTFERELTSRDPGWRLIAARSA